MTKNKFKLSLLSGVIGSLCSLSSHGADFYFGSDQGLQMQVNSQISLGASWRIEDADQNLVGAENGGATGGTGASDDGNLNFENGDTFSQILKGSHDIQFTAGDFGAFTRFKYWSDVELENGDRPHGNSNNGYTTDKPLDDNGFSDNAKFSGISLLDAYVYGAFDVADMPVDVRIGRQVLSWGESTFIQGGLNSSNPFDVSALRRPGATLKEGILPVGMAYMSVGATENLSLEAFYQYEWAKTEIDGCGTLFSTDFVASGCDIITLGSITDPQYPDAAATPTGLEFYRGDDIDPKDGGQYGLAARYFAEELNNTEFGVYFMNIHSRLPTLSVIRNSNPGVPGALPATTAGTAAAAPFIPSTHATLGALSVYNPEYFIEFPEDLQYFGLSFATNFDGLALSGEVSYKPDTPVQINSGQILNGTLSEAPSKTVDAGVIALPFSDRVIAAGPGEKVNGYDVFDVTQIQVTALQFIDRVLGASRLTLVGEVGLVLTDGIEDSAFKYGRNGVFGFGDANVGTGEGYVTDSAWGYRAQAALDYSDVFAGVSLTPVLSFSHDVEGYAPEPGAQFTEGQQSLGLSVEATYQQMYSANLAYKMFDGGDYSRLSDKDFVSLSLSINY